MAKKSFFKKRKKFNYNKYFTLGFIIIIIILFFYYFANQSYFEIPVFNESYYTVPEDKGGEKIINQDKKGLHLSNQSVDQIDIFKDTSLKFSIQIYTSNNYDVIKNMINTMINSFDSIFSLDNLYVAVLKHNFGNEFFLLYKNFNSRNEALDHCDKYVYFLDNCIIVNVQNIE